MHTNNKIEFDITSYRENQIKFAKLGSSNTNFSERYLFFYDETNNLRRLRIKNGDFNFNYNKSFILGGLAVIGELPELDQLLKELKLQENMDEIKFKHIAHGKFEDCLKSSNLEATLRYFQNIDNIFLHYYHMNFLYWALVDIVDSVISKHNIMFINDIKNTLYCISKIEIADIVSLLKKSNYPALSNEDIPKFITSLSEILSRYLHDYRFKPFLSLFLTDLKVCLNKKSKLDFIMDFKKGELLDSFDMFYLRPIYMFSNSKHIFDNENSIQYSFEKYQFILDDKKLENFKFVDSKSNLFVQFSDVLVGIISKFFEFLNNVECDQILPFFEKLNERQNSNLSLLINMIKKSNSHNQALLYNTMPIIMGKRLNIIFELVAGDRMITTK